MSKRENGPPLIWTQRGISLLIDEVRKERSLYDPKDINYLNRDKRMLHFQRICEVITEQENFKVTVNDVKVKWYILRSQLNKQLRYMERRQSYKPNLWCIDKLEFLMPFCSLKKFTPISNEISPKDSVNRNGSVPLRTTEIKPEPEPEPEAPSSSNIFVPQMNTVSQFTPNECQTAFEISNDSYREDRSLQVEDTTDRIEQIIETRIASKLDKLIKMQTSWEGQLVMNQLDLIADKTIRSDTMWAIQRILRRGIQRDQDIRGNQGSPLSISPSEFSDEGSCISWDSVENAYKKATALSGENITDLIL